MERNDILSKIQELLAEIVDNECLELTEMSAPDNVNDWDSLAHFQLVMEMQQEFGIKFTALEVQSWRCVCDIIDSIIEK